MRCLFLAGRHTEIKFKAKTTKKRERWAPVDEWSRIPMRRRQSMFPCGINLWLYCLHINLLSPLPTHPPSPVDVDSSLLTTSRNSAYFFIKSWWIYIYIYIPFKLISTILTDANSLYFHTTICTPTRVCSAAQSPSAALRPDCIHARGGFAICTKTVGWPTMRIRIKRFLLTKASWLSSVGRIFFWTASILPFFHPINPFPLNFGWPYFVSRLDLICPQAPWADHDPTALGLSTGARALPFILTERRIL